MTRAARSVEGFLLLGFARALEEGADRRRGSLRRRAFGASRSRTAAWLSFHALSRLRVQRLAQRSLVVAGAGKHRSSPTVSKRSTSSLMVRRRSSTCCFHLPERGMQRPQFGDRVPHSACGPRHIARADWRRSETAAPRGSRRRRSRRGGFAAIWSYLAWASSVPAHAPRPAAGWRTESCWSLISVSWVPTKLFFCLVGCRARSRRCAAVAAFPSAGPTGRLVARRAALDCECINSAR